MAVLTLRPSRYADADSFAVQSYAYIMADRPVTRLGVMLTPEPLTLQVNTTGELMTADLTPNALVDNEESFFYTVSVFGAFGNKLYTGNIVMPDADSDIFDLIPVTQDLDSCVPTTNQDNS